MKWKDRTRRIHPDGYNEILVWDKDTDQLTIAIRKRDKISQNYIWTEKYKGDWFEDRNICFNYWMPIPEKPKEIE